MAALPSLSHFKYKDYENFYEPSDDTFLLVDAIASDLDCLLALKPKLCLEIGSGSGCAITFLSKLLRENGITHHCVASDINPAANAATSMTAVENNVWVDCIRMNLGKSFNRNEFDVIIFNPPYVPTEDEKAVVLKFHGLGEKTEE
jgi:release factor glutamine methyltransferase